MATSVRERVAIDLRGIGDAVRKAAASRGSTVALFARQALVAALPGPDRPGLPQPGFTAGYGSRDASKLTLRMASQDAELLICNAAALGLSQGQYVASLVKGVPLPIPAAERLAERSALRSSNDQLAAIASDLSLLLQLTSRADKAGLEPLRDFMSSLDADIARHLQAASALLRRIS